MRKDELLKRYIVFTISLFISSLGVSCITRATLGTSPISSVPYVMSLHTGITMGTYTFLLNVLLMIIQFAMLGNGCSKKQASEIMLQVPVSVLFGLFIDFTMTMLGMYEPGNYVACVIELLVGCVILGLGVVGEVIANVVMLSGELTVQIASKKMKKEFGIVKMCFDVSLVVIACALSALLSYNEGVGFAIDGVREGTIVGAMIVGPIVRFFRPKMGVVERWLNKENESDDEKAESSAETRVPLVITIAREYGSGGRELGRRLAQELGISFYDKKLIAMVAAESGFTENFVKANEQNVSNSLLFELIMQDYESPIEKSLSSADSLFVAQSKVIRRIASAESCVIVGRCANYILKDRKNTLNVFIYSDEAHEVRRAVEEYDVEASHAEATVARINKSRATHYMHYTGRHWRDARNYHLLLNADYMGADETCRIIERKIAELKREQMR